MSLRRIVAAVTLEEGALPFGWAAGDITCTGLEDGNTEANGFQFAGTTRTSNGSSTSRSAARTAP